MKIKLNVAEAVASHSAVKKPSYHIVQSPNGPMVVVDSKYKPVVAKATASLKQAKTLGLAAAKLGQATAKLKLKLKTTRDAAKKAPISSTIKANNAKIKKDVTAAKKLATSAVASLAKAGLKVLDTPIRPSFITMTQPSYTIGKIGGTKADSFWVKASGTNYSPSLLKPRFATGDKFDKIGASAAAKRVKPGVKASARPKPDAAPKTTNRKVTTKTKAKAKTTEKAKAKLPRTAVKTDVDYDELSPAAREKAIARLNKQVTKYDNIIRDGATGKRLESAQWNLKMVQRELDSAIGDSYR